MHGQRPPMPDTTVGTLSIKEWFTYPYSPPSTRPRRLTDTLLRCLSTDGCIPDYSLSDRCVFRNLSLTRVMDGPALVLVTPFLDTRAGKHYLFATRQSSTFANIATTH